MSARLFVLGILNERTSHGYDLRQIAQSWNLYEWADISYGAIYHALTTLENEGLVEQSGVEQMGERPPRTLFRITEAGRTDFGKALEKAILTEDRVRHPVNLALVFLAILPPQERVALLEERLRRLEKRYQAVLAIRQSLQPLETTAPAAVAAVDHDLGHLTFEKQWTQNLIAHVTDWQPRQTSHAPQE